ncbi:hypothetical protein XA68_13393 [Ophiocordyceps unilateralis]|uniref:Cytidyltransferase-like domain-containing protein n=1 Tax=Ophiocordyceps unilateralis TaxID=268505 RepID=A0A2A9PN50_OPHUN|nr:hypothetical protein XA68_13393 [Ophiocordyceps unilateralis]
MSRSKQHLIDCFTRSLSSFQASAEPLRILSTLPHDSEPRGGAKGRQRRRRLLVLDSSFNPPTRAHQHMARTAMRNTHDATLLLLLAVSNADKAPAPASFPLRLCMMEALARKLATEENAMVDVAVTNKALFSDKAIAVANSGVYADDVELVFLVGFDTLVRILDAKYYTSMETTLSHFFHRSRLQVTIRPGDAWGSAKEQLDFASRLTQHEAGPKAEWATRIHLRRDEEEEQTAGVSSSRVRDLMRISGRGRHDDQGASEVGQAGELARLVDAEVLDWIESEHLYRNDVKDS